MAQHRQRTPANTWPVEEMIGRPQHDADVDALCRELGARYPEPDHDIVALDDEEDAFIPEGVVDAPVIKAIAALRARKNGRIRPGSSPPQS